jgi:hypothetical protein
MRRAEGPLRDKASRGVEHAGDGVDLGGLEGFFEGERRENGWQPLSEHGLSRAGRADHENVVTASGRHFKGALGSLLAANILEVDREMLELAKQGFGGDAKGLALHDDEELGVEEFDYVEQRRDRIDVDAFDDGSLGGIACRQNQIRDVFFACEDGDR